MLIITTVKEEYQLWKKFLQHHDRLFKLDLRRVEESNTLESSDGIHINIGGDIVLVMDESRDITCDLLTVLDHYELPKKLYIATCFCGIDEWAFNSDCPVPRERTWVREFSHGDAELFPLLENFAEKGDRLSFEAVCQKIREDLTLKN